MSKWEKHRSKIISDQFKGLGVAHAVTLSWQTYLTMSLVTVCFPCYNMSVSAVKKLSMLLRAFNMLTVVK